MRLRIATLVAGIAAVLVAGCPGASASPGVRALAAPGAEGGQAVYGAGGVRCVLGFNVRQSGTYYFLTAGGCAQVGMTIYADPGLTVQLGTVVSATTGGVALVRYVEPSVERPGSVYLYPGSQDITAAGRPTVGQRVCRSGPTTGVRCGSVTAVNVTVSFPQGTISGLARTNVCTEPGDGPGAPYFSGGTAVGLGIGGSGNCTSGGVSYFQPVSPVLSAFGVSVY
ncbi:S1 family peptidase [Actinomadura sp. WMMA1423]|uniref:S1 family peptidase n=1 Tax=Actinomadura sp. WMMA1423 TaxID=2591108 RepID=UPI0011477B93|nr:S1 family peptidase [Actinomadura sp. WMMA1423]